MGQPGPGRMPRPRWEGRDPLADVLPGEDDAAGLALETADVPLLVQRQERLAVLDLLLASGTVCKHKRTLLRKASWALEHCHHLSPSQGHLCEHVFPQQLPPWPWHQRELHSGRGKATGALASGH